MYNQFTSEEEKFQEPINNQIIFFFNPGSGGARALQLNSLDLKSIDVNISGKIQKVFFYSLVNPSSRIKGLEHIKNIEQTLGLDLHHKGDNQLSTIGIGGGDGTIMWVIELMIKHEINFDLCAIVPYPFGTGNDFSNVLGWGVTVPNDILGPNNNTLSQTIRSWVSQRQVAYFDICKTKLNYEENGCFYKVMSQDKMVSKAVLNDDQGSPIKVYRKKMSNYFSIGADARVGMGFDKKRTQSQCCNKCVYCWEGFKKMFLPTRRINDLISAFYPIEKKTQSTTTELPSIQEPLNIRQGQKQNTIISGNPITLVCLNIDSYSGGVQKIWKNAKTSQNVSSRNFSQNIGFSDGRLEFITFDSLLEIAQERFVGGKAQRVTQGEGPFQIDFKEFKNDVITYFQIDGEYFSAKNLQSVSIKKSEELPNGKIQVLIRNQDQSYL